MADEVITDAAPVDAVVDPAADPKQVDPAADPVVDPVPVDPPKDVPPTDTEMIAKAVEIQTVYAKDYPWIVEKMDTVAVKVDEGSKKGAEYQRFFSYKPAHFAADVSLLKAIESNDQKLIDAMQIMLKDTISYIVEDLARDRKVVVP